jgi:hypothetical protein
MVAVVLPCGLLGGPTVDLVWSGTLCPHMHAMHHQAGPCFCGHMTGGTSMDLVTPVVLPAPVAVHLVPGISTTPALSLDTSRHDSPTYPPRHPPPKLIA